MIYVLLGWVGGLAVIGWAWAFSMWSVARDNKRLALIYRDGKDRWMGLARKLLAESERKDSPS